MARSTTLFVALVALPIIGVGCTTDTPDATTTTVPVVVIAGSTTTTAPCDAASSLAASLAAIDLHDPSGLQSLPDAIAASADEVPAELKGDVLTVSNTLSSMVVILREHDFDLDAVQQDPVAQADLAALDSVSMQAAITRLQTWLGTSCGG